MFVNSQIHERPGLGCACDHCFDLDPGREMGAGRAVGCRIVPIVGCAATRPHLHGRILNPDADWKRMMNWVLFIREPVSVTWADAIRFDVRIE